MAECGDRSSMLNEDKMLLFCREVFIVQRRLSILSVISNRYLDISNQVKEEGGFKCYKYEYYLQIKPESDLIIKRLLRLNPKQ